MTRLEREIKPSEKKIWPSSPFKAALSWIPIKNLPSVDQQVWRLFPKHGRGREEIGVWLSAETYQKGSTNRNIWWWLSPTIWPADEVQYQTLLGQLVQKGARHFVLNAPWQIAFFRDPQKLSLWAGPFCNLSNPLSISQIKSYGFSGAMVSPELGQEDYLSLPRQSPLPLGIVLTGHWPLCHCQSTLGPVETGKVFSKSEGRDGLGGSSRFQLLGLPQLGPKFNRLSKRVGAGRLPAFCASE